MSCFPSLFTPFPPIFSLSFSFFHPPVIIMSSFRLPSWIYSSNLLPFAFPPFPPLSSLLLFLPPPPSLLCMSLFILRSPLLFSLLPTSHLLPPPLRLFFFFFAVLVENSARLQLACAPAIKPDKPLVIRPFWETVLFHVEIRSPPHCSAPSVFSYPVSLICSLFSLTTSHFCFWVSWTLNSELALEIKRGTSLCL